MSEHSRSPLAGAYQRKWRVTASGASGTSMLILRQAAWAKLYTENAISPNATISSTSHRQAGPAGR